MKNLLVPFLALLVLAATNVAASPIAYATTSSAQFGTIDLGTGAFSTIGHTPTALAGIAATPSGQIYGIDASNNLILIDPLTANTTTIGNAGVSLVLFAGTLSGNLYGLDFNNVLYSLDDVSGAATLVGPTGLPPIPADFAFADGLAGDMSTLFLSYQIYNNANHAGFGPSLFSIDPATGSSTLIGSTNTPATTALGFVAGSLYGPGFDGAIFDLRRFDTASGAPTIVGPITGVTGFVYGIAAPQAVPEPASLSLLGLGLVVVASRRWRKP